MHYKWHYIYKA